MRLRFWCRCSATPTAGEPDTCPPLLRFGAPPAYSFKRVRFAWGYLTQHLPSPDFLSPSTVSASRELAALFHAATLVGFRAGGVYGSPISARVLCTQRALRTGAGASMPAKTDRTHAPPWVTRAAILSSRQSKPLARRVRHSPMHLLKGTQGGGRTQRPISRDRHRED